MTRRTAENRCAKPSEWPLLDQRAWVIALQDPDPFDERIGYARRWKPKTLDMVARGYGHWIAWLERVGELDPAAEPGSRATAERLRAYLEAMRLAGLADLTVAVYLQQLGNGLRALAPEGDWSHILRAAARIRERARRVKNPRSRMRPPEELLQLGFDLMAAATADTGRSVLERAADFRDGLLIALLVHRPLRAANVAQIRIGTHLRQLPKGWSVALSAEEMKSPRPFEFDWPTSLTLALDEYLSTYRPRLAAQARRRAAGDHLFVSAQGRAFDANRVGERVFKRTQAAFGTSVNAHLFRSIAATTIATETPEEITNAARVLAHASLRTTRNDYIRARALEAGRAVHRSLEERRAAARRRQNPQSPHGS